LSLFPGIAITEQIYENDKIIIYKGYLIENQASILIKMLKNDTIHFSEAAKLINEYIITKSLHIDGIIKPIKIELTDSIFALITEDIGAVCLRSFIDSHTIIPSLFINIASQLAETINYFHEKGIVHRDLKPENIFIHPDTTKIYISGFGNSVNISSENENVFASINPEWSFKYASPEQSCRLNSKIDKRSDLYSLGVILYEILTGQLPINANSEAEWVQAHITINPIPPDKINPDIPRMVSNIIMKLLKKNVQERYQSAFGVLWDIKECKKQLNETGKISCFTIGQKDTFAYFKLPDILYGRDDEKAVLESAFARACNGGTEAVFINGLPGTGKTALVNDFLKPLVIKKGYFITGKVDQLKKNIPYVPFADAFESLIMQLMTESGKVLNHWKRRILTVLKKNGAVITEIIPKLECIIGKQSPVDELPPKEAENRFFMALRDFVCLFARKDHPLVIFIDDLHWADFSSIQLMDYLINEANINNFLFVGAYRDNELNENHSLIKVFENATENKFIRFINTLPLDWKQTLSLVSDALHTSSDKVISLAEVLYRESGGNPFFLRQLLKLVHDRELIYFDTQKSDWKWKPDAIQQLNLGNDVLQIFLRKFKGLPYETQEIMKWISCLGSIFDLSTLALIWGKPVEGTVSDLIPAIHEGLVLPVSNKATETLTTEYSQSEVSQYRFLHDRVQQVIYSLIDEKERKKKHQFIGRLLLQYKAGDDLDENILLIMDHFSRSLELFSKPEERLMIARYGLMAGRKARNSAAYISALQYFRIGKSMLDDTSWDNEYSLTYDLYLEMAQAEFMSANVDAAEILFDTVIEKGESEVERATVYGLKVILYASVGEYDEAIKTGITALKKLGVKIPEHPTKLDYFRELLIYKWQMRNKKIEDLVNLPEINESKQRKITELLCRLSTVTMIYNPDLYYYTIIKSGNHAVCNGNSYMASVGYFGYSLTEGCILGNYNLSSRYSNVCIDLAERYGVSSAKCIIYFVVGAFITHWNKHASFGLEYLKKAITYGTESGDVLIIGYAYCLILENCYLMGCSLAKIAEMVKKKKETTKRLKHDNLTINVAIYERVVSILQASNEESYESSISEYQTREFLELVQRDKASLATYYCNKTYLCYMSGDYMEALAVARSVEPLINSVLGFLITAKYYFYYSLVIITIYDKLAPKDKKQLWRKLKKHLRQMKKWSVFCKENFLHKYQLIKAEIANFEKNDTDAGLLYNMAIQSAHENGYIQDEALANELASKFYISRGMKKIGMSYMVNSIRGYYKWGAISKVRQLQKQYNEIGDLVEQNLQKDDDTDKLLNMLSISIPGNSKSEVRLDNFLIDNALEELLKETDINKMLKKFLKISVTYISADRGFLILNRNGELLIKEIIDNNSSQIITQEALLEQSNNLSKAIVRYVARTHETVIVNCGQNTGIFDTDPYIIHSNSKSIASLPLIYQGEVVGVLYFENSFMTGVFTQELLEALKRLAICIGCSKKIQLYLEDSGYNNEVGVSQYLIDPLTERETEVLRLIAEGMSNMEIADKLDITINTVKGYIKNIYLKLGVNRRVQVVKKARELNILK
jgi:predicted ATPase/DNA-binding CsgD family transcriptional regulator